MEHGNRNIEGSESTMFENYFVQDLYPALGLFLFLNNNTSGRKLGIGVRLGYQNFIGGK